MKGKEGNGKGVAAVEGGGSEGEWKTRVQARYLYSVRAYKSRYDLLIEKNFHRDDRRPTSLRARFVPSHLPVMDECEDEMSRYAEPIGRIALQGVH